MKKHKETSHKMLINNFLPAVPRFLEFFYLKFWFLEPIFENSSRMAAPFNFVYTWLYVQSNENYIQMSL